MTTIRPEKIRYAEFDTPLRHRDRSPRRSDVASAGLVARTSAFSTHSGRDQTPCAFVPILRLVVAALDAKSRRPRPKFMQGAPSLSCVKNSSTTPASSNGIGDLQFLFPSLQGRHRAFTSQTQREMAMSRSKSTPCRSSNFVANKGNQ